MKATLILLSSLALIFSSFAGTRTWIGNGGNNLWSNPNNWSPTGAPQNGDELNFFNLCPVPPCPVTIVNDLSNLQVGRLKFGDSASGDVEYVINGNALRLTDWVLVGIPSGDDTPQATVTFNCPLRLETNANIQVAYGGYGGFPSGGQESRLFLNGDILLNGHDLEMFLQYNLQNSRSRVDFAGAIIGTGNVSIWAGEGCTAQFNGNADNTFTGTLTFSGVFNEDKLVLNKTGGKVAHDRVVIGGVCRWEHSDQIGDGATVVVTDDLGYGAGKLYLQGHDQELSHLRFEELGSTGGIYDGMIDTGGGLLKVRSLISTESDAGTPVIRGRLAVPDIAATLDISGTEFYGLDIQAELSGGAAMTKTGGAGLLLSSSNSFSGALSISAGSVEPGHPNALGSVSGTVFLYGGALRLINQTIVGKSLIAVTAGSTLFSQGPSTWAGRISLNTNLAVYGENLALTDQITGSGGLTLVFGGTVTLAGSQPNTFTGVTDVSCDLLRLNKPSNTRAFSGPLIVRPSAGPIHEVRWLNNFQLPPAANITLYDHGLLALNNFTETVSNLTFTGGHVNLASDSALTMTGSLTSNPADSTALIDGATGAGALYLSGQRSFNIADGLLADPDLRIDARIGSGGIVKNGEGTLALGGNNFFSGLVTISNGIVRAEHSNALGSSVAGTVVNSGATLALATPASLVREPLTLSGSGLGATNGALMASGTVTLSNNVVLAAAATIRVDTGSSLTINGVISGTGPLSKIGGGTLTLAGTANNTFSGDMLADAGTLQLGKFDFLQAVPGNLVIGGVGQRGTTSATVRHLAHDQIWSNVTINAHSLLDLNGHDEYLLALTLNGGGDVQTGAGLLTLEGNLAGNSLTVNPGTELASSTISGRLGLRTGNHHISVGSFPVSFITGPELDVPAQIQYYNGLANLHKGGSGEMRLRGSNNFTGALYVNDGRVTAAHNWALGTTNGITVVSTNGTLALDGGIITTNRFIILDTAATVALTSLTGSNTVNASINLLQPNTGIEVTTNGSLQLLGRVGSIGGLTKLGAGTLRFLGTTSNDYAGLTIVSNGVVEASRANIIGTTYISIPGDVVVSGDASNDFTASLRLLRAGQMVRGASVNVRSNGVFELATVVIPATSATLRNLLGGGTVQLGGNTSVTISNIVSFDFDGVFTGAGSFNKRGIASMVLLGDSPSYTGTMTVFDGRLRVHGSLPNSPVQVQGGSLRGDGRVGAVTVHQDGTVAPDSEFPGGLAGDLQMSTLTNLAGGLVDLEFYGTTPQGGNDLMLVNGPVDLDGGLSAGIKYAAHEGDVLTVIRKTTPGAINGTFNGWTQGATKIVNDLPVRINYAGGDGNDLTLTITNLALESAGYVLAAGNGNQQVEPDECNLLYAFLHNRRGVPVTITSAVLRSLTTGAIITKAQAAYPTIPAGGVQSNATPFQLRTPPTLPCGASVLVELQLTVPGEGTFAVPYLLIAGTNCTGNGGGCESCTVVAGQFTTNSSRTIRVPEPFGAPSTCLPHKTCPGPMIFADGVRYVAHAFTNTSGADACITAQLHYDCTSAPVGSLLVAAYADQFDSSDVCQGFLGDAGALLPDASPPFSFTVTNGGRFEIVVVQLIDVPACPNYWAEVFGVPCPLPTLHIAKDAAPGNVRLHWSTAYPDFRLQSVGSLNGPAPFPFQNLSNTVSILSGQYSVIDAATNSQRMYRLAK